MAKKKKKRRASCKHLDETHCVFMTSLEALQLVSAATYAVRHGYSERMRALEEAVNGILVQCNIDCEFDEDGVMTLTVNPIGDE